MLRAGLRVAMWSGKFCHGLLEKSLIYVDHIFVVFAKDVADILYFFFWGGGGVLGVFSVRV